MTAGAGGSGGERDPSALLEVIHGLLLDHPEGLSEFALFAELAKRGFREFDREVFRDSMRMFQSHFVLFHVLHRMRERLADAQEGHLVIETLSIRLGPWQGDVHALASPDPVAAYYLDRANLDETTEADLRAMLDAFWERYAAHGSVAEALGVLELAEGAGWEDVNAKHRALVFAHHPDRGGDASRLAEINRAMRILRTARGGR